MGYSSDHKDRTRERVVTAAGRLFRRYGYNGVGIDEIMAAAGLTRGGFYAHLKSKRDRFAAKGGGARPRKPAEPFKAPANAKYASIRGARQR